MATVYENVHLSSFRENGQFESKSDAPFRIEFVKEKTNTQMIFRCGGEVKGTVIINGDLELCRMGKQALAITQGEDSFMLKFPSINEIRVFHRQLKNLRDGNIASVFDSRTDKASAEQYFQFYGYLSQQQNMMQDFVRTSTYQRAMLDNTVDFQDKVVLDVGAGSGILSFFAYQAGARKVYAIEASSMANHCKNLVRHNKLEDKISVIMGKVEEVEVPETVDIIISEPMGYMLFNERMLESYLHAKKWLRPGGKMFPSQGDLHIAPFTDDALYMEQFSKANFWHQPSFHGVDLSNLRQAAVEEYFRQPIVDTFDVRILMAKSVKYTVDFETAHETDLHTMDIPLLFHIHQSGTIHGLAFWFDVAFIGSQVTTWLSTAPTQPLTHWYQVRCLLETPVFVKQGQTVSGKALLRSNNRQSYDVDIEVSIPGTSLRSQNTLDLKNPFFRYTGQQPQPPPGTNNTSPNEAYWSQVDATGLTALNSNYSMLNGGIDGSQMQLNHSPGASQANLIPVANAAPVNPGSIPSVGVIPHSTISHRTSVGGGISPALIQASHTTSNGNSTSYMPYPVSSQFMIGDYVIPGNMLLNNQTMVTSSYKA